MVFTLYENDLKLTKKNPAIFYNTGNDYVNDCLGQRIMVANSLSGPVRYHILMCYSVYKWQHRHVLKF